MAKKKPTPKVNEDTKTAEAEAKVEKDAAEVEANAQIEQDRNEPADDSGVAELAIETRTKNGTESHWRGGKEHTKEKKSWPAGTFTADQIAKIKNDPHLTVKVLSD